MESDITKYIGELLMRHDCVIIPGFGAILANPSPSYIDPASHLVYPPNKKLAFNPLLKTSDGLLAHQYASGENLSFEAAMTGIRNEVTQWTEELHAGKKIILRQVGSFILDGNGKIIFEPEGSKNYLVSSYGLEAVTIHPVERKTFIPEPVEYEEPEPAMGRAPVRKHYGRLVTYSLAGYLPVLLLLWLFFMAREPFTGSGPQMSGIVTPVQNEPAERIANDETPMVSPEEPVKEEADEAIPVEEAPETMTLKMHYFVIGGSFLQFDNAEAFQNKLSGNHYDSRILESKDGNFRVSYGGFVLRKEAVDFMTRLREKGINNVWILKQ